MKLYKAVSGVTNIISGEIKLNNYNFELVNLYEKGNDSLNVVLLVRHRHKQYKCRGLGGELSGTNIYAWLVVPSVNLVVQTHTIQMKH